MVFYVRLAKLKSGKFSLLFISVRGCSEILAHFVLSNTTLYAQFFSFPPPLVICMSNLVERLCLLGQI